MSAFENIAIKDIVSGNDLIITAAGAAKVDGSGVVQPVSGTVTIVPSGTQDVNISSSVAITVTATNLDIRDLLHTQDSIRIGDGTELANVTPSGELNVLASAQPGVDIGDVTINNGAGGSAVNIQDGGNSITVDGPLTDVQLRATPVPISATNLDIRDLVFASDKVDASGSSVSISSLPNEGQQNMANSISVAIASDQSSLPINDNGSSITVDNAGTFAVQAAQSGTWSVRNQDGSGNALTSATRGSERALSVQIVDGSGTQITTFGGGTQYTEDVASVADPIGNQLIARRRDSLSSETTTDGDNTALNSTAKGELYVKHVDSIPITDNGGSVTVDATNLDIRDLTFASDKVDASGTVLGAGTNNIGDVDVLTLPAITGTVTANAGTNLNTSALALETTASAIKTAVEIIDNAISGSEMQVDIVASIPAGNNNIGDVDIASIAAGTNYIGKVRLTDGVTDAEVVPLAGFNAQAVAIVDGTGVQITSFGGGTQYTEGDVDATITGNAMLMEVAGNTLQPIQGTVADGLLVNLGSNNDVVITSIPGTAAEAAALPSVFVVVAGDDGTDTHPLQLSATGDLKITLDGEAVVLGAGSASIGILGANSGVDIGDVTINNGAGGSAVNIQDGGNSITVDNNGTFLIQENGAALTALQLLDDAVATTAAAIPGKGFAISGTDGTNARIVKTDTNGELQIDVLSIAAGTNLIGYVSHGKTVKTVTSGVTAITADTDIIAAVTSKRIKVISYAFFTDSTTQNILVLKSNGAGGTALWTVPLQSPAAGAIFGANLATEAPGFIFATNAGEKLTVDVSSAVNVWYSLTYYDDDTN